MINNDSTSLQNHGSLNFDAKILIVDDQLQNVELLERILTRAGFKRIISTVESIQFLSVYHEFKPDIVLLDLHMPEVDGFELLSNIRKSMIKDDYIPILVLTADTNSDSKRRALSAGANDFLNKPLDRSEVLLRIKNLLETRRLHIKLKAYNHDLEIKIADRTNKLELAQYEVLELMAKFAEFRDDNTGKHTERVGNLSKQLAIYLGMDDLESESIRLAAPLHDIGKIGIPDSILLKPAKLTTEEFSIMKAHTLIGKEILSENQFPILKMGSEIAESHHENWDGSGYPYGLIGHKIPIVGQIVSIVDVYDALTHKRPYKNAWTIKESLLEIKNQSGKKFNPYLVEVFLKLITNMDK